MKVINDELIESFNVKVNNNIVSININTTKLMGIDELIHDREQFEKALEFVLTHNAELVPGLLTKAIDEINNLCKTNENICYKLKMLHHFYDKYQLDEAKKLDGTTFDENDISDLKFDKILPKMYVAVVAYENNKFSSADFIKVKNVRDNIIVLENGQVFNRNGIQVFKLKI